MDRTAEERFLEKIRVDPKTGCWVWTASLFTKNGGYGQFRWSPTKNGYAHIWSYTHFVGPVPEGLTLDHLCKNPSCANPAHLEPVTMRENILRSDGAAALNARKTHCPKGHEYTVENTRVRDGRRHCRACGREHRAAWVAANPERAREIMRAHDEKRRGTRRKAQPPAGTT